MEETTNTTATPPSKSLVNPIALQNTLIYAGEHPAKLLDISFVRCVVESAPGWEELPEGESLTFEFQLDRYRFSAQATVKGKRDGWIRLAFDKIVPSARSHMRSFLSPKKIGESIVEDWRNASLRHYHGLNESELWFDPGGPVLFTYLDQSNADAQFILRTQDFKGPLHVGNITRKDYIELSTMEAELPLIPLSDRDIYQKLGECRDIVTNFRPTGQLEYNLKQRLLKVISDHLYSTSHKVDFSPPRPPRVVTLPLEQ